MARALEEFEISGRGVKTTIPFHQRILQNEQFRGGDVTTDFVEQFMAEEKQLAAAAG
jgi:acetyl-CoA carboxylase biotin carboxylase subunit